MKLCFKQMLLLFSAAVFGAFGGAVEAQENGPFAEYDLRVVMETPAGLQSLAEAFESGDYWRQTLANYAPEACAEGTELPDCIAAFERIASGEGGLYATKAAQVAFIARSAINEAGEFIGLGGEPRVSGQINEYCLSSPEQPGFYFLAEANRTGGAFSVICVTVKTETAQLGVNPGKTFYQNYMVKVENWGWDQRGKDPNDIFPVAAKATGVVVKASDANAEFTLKLYAAGDQMQVLTYWTSFDGTNWDQFSASSPPPPPLDRIFEINPMACIDMMFIFEPPLIDGAYRLPSNWQGGLNYCLGRCKEPPRLINTQ